MQDLIKILNRVWHFRHLSIGDLKHITEAGQIKNYRADETIFEERLPAAGMFVLFRGKVHLYRLSPSGAEQIIATIEPVIMFNELTAIDGGPNPYTAIAVQDCRTWNISHESFKDLVIRYPDPEIGLGLLRVLAGRTRLLIDRCEDLSFRPVLARTAKLILDLSDFGLQEISRQENPLKDMAAHIATVPEAISRSLKTLKEDGVIEYDRTMIRVVHPGRLAELAQVDPFLNHP